MNNLKSLLFFISIIFFATIFINQKLKKPSSISSSISRVSSRYSSSLQQTCIESYDVNRLRKSIFHMSMIHFQMPLMLREWVQNKTGFEIGGPSQSTWGAFGVYDAAKTIDATNFASTTFWSSGLKDGSPFLWKNQTKGKQYIRDGVDLRGIPSETYDFVLASHVLEHIANPFKALLEWIRILHSDGLLLIIVPFKNMTFDHKRNVTQIEHLINDYHNETKESDLSHLNEILSLHDIVKDYAAGGIEAFKSRSQKNFENRGLHQHVYDQELLYYIFLCLNLNVKIQFTWDYHNFIIGQK